jgi:hypothetical protein
VLWFDLMFDVQVMAHRGADVPEAVLASIAGYYRRVTTEARPMNRLVAAVMAATVVAAVAQALRGDVAPWVSAVTLVALVAPIGLAGARTVPRAVRLGTRADPLPAQAAMARAIGREHLACVASISVVLATQLLWA